MQAKTKQAAGAPAGQGAGAERVRSALESHAEGILGTLQVFIFKSGLAAGNESEELAHEVLAELVVEALDHADRLDPTRRPLPWLLGIGANLVQRRRVDAAKRLRREPHVLDLPGVAEGRRSEDECFDLLAGAVDTDPAARLAAAERIESMLAPLSEEDQRVVRLGILHEWSGEELGQELGISAAAARKRLSRALQRLRRRSAGSAGQEDGRQ